MHPDGPPAPAAEPAHPPGGGGELVLRANKLALLERLSDDLAHEIKNPLHSMVINLEVLKRRVGRADAADDVLRYIGVLAGELERVNRRIELLLRLSRPGRGAEATTLNELTEELMELIQLEARHHEVSVDYQPGTAAARVFVPREPARQVILNLVLEVIDRLGRGGCLRLGVREEGGRARVLVGGGEGAAAAAGWREVEDGTRSDAPVAVARALAQRAGGRVELDPGADGGAALVFSLPIATGNGAARM